MPTTSVDDLCRNHNLTFDQLVERSGLESTRVQAIYLGRWTPSPAERKAIADVFGVGIDDVTWGHKTPIQHIYGHGPS
jgi:transcriptional regulator with XRE-family HTH domain